MRLKMIAATAIVILSWTCGAARAETLGDSIAGQWAVVGMSTSPNGDIYVIIRKPGEKPALCVIGKPNFATDLTAYSKKCLSIL